MSRHSTVISSTLIVLALTTTVSAAQALAVHPVEENALRAYAGVYCWEGLGYVYLQIWNELSGKNELVAFDETGQVRTLYPTENDRFFATHPDKGKFYFADRQVDVRTGAIRLAALFPNPGESLRPGVVRWVHNCGRKGFFQTIVRSVS